MIDPDTLAALRQAKPSWMDGKGLFPGKTGPQFPFQKPASVVHIEAGDYEPVINIPAVVLQADSPSSQNQTYCPNLNQYGTVPSGVGTDHPLAMTYANWQAACAQFAGSPTYCPLSTHSATLDVTPPCPLTGEVTASSSSPTAARVAGGCYLCESVVMLSGSGGGTVTDPDCPTDFPDRSFTYGASGIITERVDFGDAVQDANGVVWVRYSLTVNAQWTCTTTGCQDADGNPCTIPPATDCGTTGGTDMGDVCSNVMGFADPFASPCSGTSVGIVFTGSGWVTGVPSSPPNPGIGLSLCLIDPTTVPGCTPRLDFTY